ncbi:MAG: bifunctional riboflavin kinase/FAD synthetase [Peptoniphilaceae bacterium]|nr:bifunctional riboflavin kinase/FAD synthetase [Peptoniphilaceae bacterium]MDD7382999.1 bifunctional riboflavin kinase/FAD synthetase [Peptoniphilaceae bacterium]MDY3737750.1 bifunctional riboflavin kinase/FAD synthetase [Peptoniphilaceae bacterium]
MSNNRIRIIDLDKDENDFNPKAIALGNFDGLHRGHMSLMNETIKISLENELVPSVLLFKENTRELLQQKGDYLTSLTDKINILVECGIKSFVLVKFDEKFSSLSRREFISKFLIERLNVKYIIVGEDYKFGHLAKGNVSYLKENEEYYGYKTKIVPLKNSDGHKINSTEIKSLIRSGKIKKANERLGRNYSISGTVIKGKQRGRTLGFPTANLNTDFNYTLPKNGVYFTKIIIENKSYYGLTDIGNNPTFENKEKKIETFIVDFNSDIYAKKITIQFLEFMRNDYEFESADKLVEQMNKDLNNVKIMIKSLKNR